MMIIHDPFEIPLELGLLLVKPPIFRYQSDKIRHPCGLECQEALHDLSTVRRRKDDLHTSLRHLTVLIFFLITVDIC